MHPIAVLQHSPEVPPGYLADAIELAGLPSFTVKLQEGDPFPDLDTVSAIVSLGGRMGAYNEDAYPFLVDEKAYMRQAVGRDLPVLGICLGCQLLAEALGGRAYKAEQLEAEFVGLDLSPAGKSDPVVRTLATPVVSFHEDTWEAPPGATLLASSRRYPHAFRYGSALAIQSHPEASEPIVARWVDGQGRDQLRAIGVSPDELLIAIAAAGDANEARAAELFARWLDEVRERTA